VHRAVRPAADEHHAFYAGYIGQVPEGDVLDALVGGIDIATALLHDVEEGRAVRGYAPGKWSIKEVVLHCADAERIFAYRALRIARGDTTPLPGWDEQAYTPAGRANERPLAELLHELETARAATVALFAGLPADTWTLVGRANDTPVSVRALAWITAGHLLHHLDVLQDRYLSS